MKPSITKPSIGQKLLIIIALISTIGLVWACYKIITHSYPNPTHLSNTKLDTNSYRLLYTPDASIQDIIVFDTSVHKYDLNSQDVFRIYSRKGDTIILGYYY